MATANTATNVPWWDQAYAAIQRTPVQPNQVNSDWGAMRDAFLVSTAQSGLNYELTRALQASANNDEKGLMQLSADLDRRNTLDLMAGEQQFKIEGLQVANSLSKDYLAAEGAQSRANIAAQGDVDIALQGSRNTGAVQVAQEQGTAARDVATTEAAASSYAADQGLAGTKAQAFAQQYVSEQQRAGAENVASIEGLANRDIANRQSQAQEYGADKGLESAKAQAFAEQYVSEQQRAGAENVASTQAGAARDVAREEGNTARDVATIQGGFGLQSVQTQEAGATQRTGMELASAERQIGLSGGESRKTIQTQGEESRKGIVTEGEQSRETIRAQGDESRRSLAFDREHAAKLATQMSRRG